MQAVLKRNNVSIIGTGPQDLVFAHGFGCDQNMWRFLTPEFVEQYRVILFDYTGSGQSDINGYDLRKYSKLEGYADDILDICRALKLQNVILIGHSVSATIATLAAIRAPEQFSRLIHICPSPCFLNDPPAYMGGFELSDLEELLSLMDKNYIGWANYLAPIVIGGQASDILTGELSDSFCSTDPVVTKNFARTTFMSDNRADYAKTPVPVLIIQSQIDNLASLEVGEFLHRITPKSKMRVIESEGHCPHMTHPSLVVNAIKSYLLETS
jgi:sigma-B regulation protein RsbQ